MRFLMISLLVFAWSGMTSIQSSDGSCCRMEISTPVKSTELRVKVTNLKLAQVSIVRTAAEFALRIRITGQNGREPPLTKYGKGLLAFQDGSRVRTGLAQHETLTEVLDLEKLYELAPGTYAVTVSRDILIGERKVELQAKTTIKVQ